MSNDDCKTVADWLKSSRSAVAFTGAGISTESGIPDFRSPGGVWATSKPVYFEDFLSDPSARLEYWRQKAISHHDFWKAKPNVAHVAIARWEEAGWLEGVITQNIDGLHGIAGSRNVLELHGTAREIGCLRCLARFDADEYVSTFEAEQRVPECPKCGGLLKHATVSFGQSLPEDVLTDAVNLSREAELFLAVGSSLVVEPAASMPRLAKRSGARLVIVNRDPTPLDDLADLILRDPIGEVFASIDKTLK